MHAAAPGEQEDRDCQHQQVVSRSLQYALDNAGSHERTIVRFATFRKEKKRGIFGVHVGNHKDGLQEFF
jgi:hypothetical protein